MPYMLRRISRKRYGTANTPLMGNKIARIEVLIATISIICQGMIQRELKIRHVQKLQYETVLVMQGGGSLGAYECGVYKALSRHGIKFDIVAGTSIGAINAAIIAGSKNDRPEKDLEDFWLEVAETA